MSLVRDLLSESSLKVLIVEDDHAMAFLIKAILERDHIRDTRVVMSVSDAKPLLEWADVVVSDWEFPGGGFPSLKPFLLKERKPYIIQSSDDRSDSSDFLLGIVNKSKLNSGLPPLYIL